MPSFDSQITVEQLLLHSRLRVTSPATCPLGQTPTWFPIRFGTVPQGFKISANNHPEFHTLGNVG